MRRYPIITAMGLLGCVAASNLSAQSKGGGLAIIPMVGYSIAGGNLAQDDANDIQLKPKNALTLGGALELGLSKTMGIDVGGNISMSQTLDVRQGGASVDEEDLTMTQLYGSLVIRPKGRRPNGGVTPLFIEIGGGVTMYKLGSAALPNSDFNATEPMGFAGIGYNLPIGPRATIQLFGRAQYINAYSSSGLDDFNAQPPVTNVEGKGMMNFVVGGALRIGR